MMFSASLVGLAALGMASLGLAQNCVLTVPPNALTAQGLATPYTMTGCSQINFGTEGCFVEATILDPATGKLSIYNPLVVNQGAVVGVDFIAPVVPTLPANAVVGIWFGSNALTLTLTGSLDTCVNGDGNSVFGQFAYCNAPAFFTAAATAVSAGLLQIPPPGSTTKAATVQPCPVTRDFRMVDMDQSDNVDSTYLLINGKMLAQNTAANAAANKNATDIANGSDNALLNDFLGPTLGCTSFTAPCITNPNGVSASMAINELQSQYFPPAAGPALIPLNDDFAVVANGGSVTQSLAKVNLYRAGVGQPQAADAANASGTTYCMQYAASGLFIAQNEALFTGATSPVPAVANSLFTFLANRFATSFGPVPSLGCVTIFGLANSPVTQTMDGNGVVTAATINTQVLQNILNGMTQTNSTSNTSTIASTAAAGNLSTTLQLSTTAPISTPGTVGNLSITAKLPTTAKVVSTTNMAISAIASTTATPSVSAPASTTATLVVPTTTVVEIITFFEFVLALGGLPPAVTGNGETFLVFEEEFVELASAASAACNHQFNTCSGLAGPVFGVAACTSQMNSCQGVATTASATASTPTTLSATATVPTTVTSTLAATASLTSAVLAPSPAVTSAAAVALPTGAGAGAVAGAVDNAAAGAGAASGSCSAVATSISVSISTVTVTVTAPAGAGAATTAYAIPTMNRYMKRDMTAKLTHW